MKQNKPIHTNKIYLKTLLLLAVFLFAGYYLMAQGPGGDPEGDPDLVPIDGGLSFLLAAGVGYGVKKARDFRKKRTETKEANTAK